MSCLICAGVFSSKGRIIGSEAKTPKNPAQVSTQNSGQLNFVFVGLTIASVVFGSMTKRLLSGTELSMTFGSGRDTLHPSLKKRHNYCVSSRHGVKSGRKPHKHWPLAQPGSACALGAGGRRFESYRPDQLSNSPQQRPTWIGIESRLRPSGNPRSQKPTFP